MIKTMPSWFKNLLIALLCIFLLGHDPIYWPDEHERPIVQEKMRVWYDFFIELALKARQNLKDDPDFEHACWGVLIWRGVYIWTFWDFSILEDYFKGQKWRSLRDEIEEVRYPVERNPQWPANYKSSIIDEHPEILNPTWIIMLTVTVSAAGWLAYLYFGNGRA